MKKKIKEIRNLSKAKDIIEESKMKKAGKRKPLPRYALEITDELYIMPDARCWKVLQKNHTINKQTGKPNPDKPFLYYGELHDAIKGLAKYHITIPDEVKTIQHKIDEMCKMIDKRVPKGVKPYDLFKELPKGDDE